MSAADRKDEKAARNALVDAQLDEVRKLREDYEKASADLAVSVRVWLAPRPDIVLPSYVRNDLDLAIFAYEAWDSAVDALPDLED
jgi:hypothetical protein